jgi:hypothetical protein
LEYLNRSNQYNAEPVSAQDQVSIDTYGLIPMSPITAHQITDPTVANVCANLLLQRAVNIRSQYSFQVGWNYAYLEPTDIVTLTDSYLGLSLWPVRVIIVEEDDAGLLTITAEDAPPGAASFVQRKPNSGTGYSIDYNAQPQPVAKAIFFEPPSELTTTGLAVWVAATGALGDTIWGGCNVWLSLDGTTYTMVGSLSGPARVGHLTGNVTDLSSAATVPIVLDGIGGALISVSASDLTNFSTLTYIGGANPEYIAYQTATLTGTNAYNLTSLVRGAYNTVPGVHATNDPVIRVDQSVSRGDNLDLAKIGSTVYFKLQSFNVWGAGTQALSFCTVYPYTIQGTMARIAPQPPTTLAVTAEVGGLRIKWTLSITPTVNYYEIRLGSTWAGAAVVGKSNTTDFLWTMQVAGNYSFWVAAYDKFGNYSAPVNINASILQPGPILALSASIVDNNALFTWTAPASGSQYIAHYEIRKGATYATAVLIGLNGPSTFFTYFESAAGSYKYWITAIDAANNYGIPVAITCNVQQPPDYILRADYFSSFVGTPINTMVGGQQGSNVTVSAANVVTSTGTTNGVAKAAAPFPRGAQFYFEVLVQQATASLRVGIAQASSPLTQLGLDATSFAYTMAGAIVTNGANLQSGLAALATGSIVGVLINQAANQLYFFVNGVQQGTAVTIPSPAIGATCSYATNVMTQVGAPSSGAFAIGQAVIAAGVPAGTTIVSGSGPYTLSATVGTIATEATSAYLPWYGAVSTLSVGDSMLVNFGATTFRTELPSGGANGMTNAMLDAGTLVAPIDIASSFALHFTSSSWASPSAQVATYPIYIEPTLSTGSYEELIDYGTVLPATTISVTPTYSTISGAVTVAVTIYTSLDGVTWTNQGAGLSAVLVQSFRYVRVHLDFTGTGTTGTNLIRMAALETKLAVKQRRDSGSGITCLSTDTQTSGPHAGSAGTWVPFNYPFISAGFPQVQIANQPVPGVNGAPWTAVIDYTGPANPTGFGVLIYNSSGARVSVATPIISWTASGF